MNGLRKDVVIWLKENKNLDIPATTIDYYRHFGLLNDCIVEKGKCNVYDIEKTGVKIAKIVKLHVEERLLLREIKDLIDKKQE